MSESAASPSSPYQPSSDAPASHVKTAQGTPARSFGNADSDWYFHPRDLEGSSRRRRRRRNVLIAVSVLLPVGLWLEMLGYEWALLPLLAGWVALIGLVAT